MKRDYGSGSIARHKNGTFQAKLRVVIDGRATRLSLGYARTRREAVQLLNEGRRRYYDAAGRKLPRGAADTVESLIERWLDKVVRAGRPSTYELYRKVLRQHVIPIVGQKRLDSLTRADVEAVQRQAHERGLKPNTIKTLLGIFSASLTYAVDKEELPGVRNVVRGADRLYRLRPRSYQFLSPQDATRLLAAVADSPYGNAYAVILAEGLRLNEALALRWQDVDLELATLRVEHSMAWVDGLRVLGETKTEKSRRAMDISATSVAALKAQRKTQMAEQARAGSEGFPWLNHDGLVFTSAWGAPASDSAVRKDFTRCLRAAGLPRMRLHDLRHSCATILLASGLPVNVVSEKLGHSSASMTWNVYGHVIPATRRAAADAMDRALSI